VEQPGRRRGWKHVLYRTVELYDDGRTFRRGTALSNVEEGPFCAERSSSTTKDSRGKEDGPTPTQHQGAQTRLLLAFCLHSVSVPLYVGLARSVLFGRCSSMEPAVR